jgi:hypothetical protein
MKKGWLPVPSGIFTWILSGVLCQYCAAFAGQGDQQAVSDWSPTLPDAPSAPPPQSNQTAQLATGNHLAPEEIHTKRPLGIVPNFEAVSANVKLPRQSAKQKFKDATDDSFDYSSLIFIGGLAGAGQASNSTLEFHQGAAGYARYYWHTFLVRQTRTTWWNSLFLLHYTRMAATTLSVTAGF